jgi:hypothetical protein
MVLEKLEIHIYIETISKSLVDQYIEIKPENVKLPKERIEKPLEFKGTSSNFLSRILILQQIRESIDKWHCIKHKVSAQQRKKSATKSIQIAIEMFSSSASDKGQIN